MQVHDKPALSEDEQLAFSQACLRQPAPPRRAKRRSSRCIVVAGIRIRLRFCGAALHDALIGALSHLLVPDDAPVDATFNIWESATTHVGVPDPPCPREHLTDRGDIWGMESDRILEVPFTGGNAASC